MNQIKGSEHDVAALLARILEAVAGRTGPLAAETGRQAAIARTEFESAFMRLNRAVAAPVSPWTR